MVSLALLKLLIGKVPCKYGSMTGHSVFNGKNLILPLLWLPGEGDCWWGAPVCHWDSLVSLAKSQWLSGGSVGTFCNTFLPLQLNALELHMISQGIDLFCARPTPKFGRSCFQYLLGYSFHWQQGTQDFLLLPCQFVWPIPLQHNTV